MEFIDFLLAIVVILYVIRMIFRVVLPMLFQKVVNKAQQHHQQNYHQNYQQNFNSSSSPKQGTVKIDHIPQQQKGKIPDSEGDFIDYEEIK
jgi:hypothetical protein